MWSGLVARLRSLWSGVRRGERLHDDMDEEFRHHLELRAADLVRDGFAPAEAARRARIEFGSTERYKDAGRASRGLRWFDQLGVSWLDFKLGFRMLARYPGLTIIGGVAMAFAIWVGAGTFELVSQLVAPRLPLPDGERLVALRLWNVQRNRIEPRLLHDLETWRRELRTVEELGAYRTVERNLILASGMASPVTVAEISATGFRAARATPTMGRTLVAGDERPGAPPVLVIGHDVWQSRFGGAPDVVGQTVQLGRVEHTVVGVMPAGYGFPVRHNAWVPLRLNVLEYEEGQGPPLVVAFGLLAGDASLADAESELATLGARRSAALEQTHQYLRPQVMPYTRSVFDLNGLETASVWSMNLFLVMLLVLVCGNVALLMFARAATREAEITVRNALGASRGRIVMQFFAEALVLGGVAAVVGLLLVDAGLRWAIGGLLIELGHMPFWVRDAISPMTVLYVAVLTVLGALIAGVMPALKVTRGLNARLKAMGAGGGGLRFGGVWTAVIVSQVALTLAFPVAAMFTQRDARNIRAIDIGVATREYLTAMVDMDRDPPPGAADTSRAAYLARYTTAMAELERRLVDEGVVTQVAFADRLPLMYHPHRIVELDSGPAAPRRSEWPNGYRVTDASVDLDYFELFDAPALQGRLFHSGDVGSDQRSVIVNEPFVRLVMGGRNPVGRRIRYVSREEVDHDETVEQPWYEIVGVVENLGTAVGADVGQRAGGDPKVAAIYHPLRPNTAGQLRMALRVPGGDPGAVIPKVRAVATAVDPTLRLYDLKSLDMMSEGDLRFLSFWFRLILTVSGVALLLSLAGIYAVMSFTVARRTREIGIRVALGASRQRIVAAVFRRPIIQVALGLVAGMALVTLMTAAIQGFQMGWKVYLGLAGYAIFMTMVCTLACVVPTRRALSVQPTDALRTD